MIPNRIQVDLCQTSHVAKPIDRIRKPRAWDNCLFHQLYNIVNETLP